LGGFNSSTPLFILKSYGLFLFFLGYEIFFDEVSFFFLFDVESYGRIVEDELTPTAIRTDQLYEYPHITRLFGRLMKEQSL
jgi:hypothetical protein